jgi:hypothetical protein
MAPSSKRFSVSKGNILQLPASAANTWIKQQLDTNEPFKILYDYFTDQRFVFHIERAKVFVQMGTGSRGTETPAVLGILPSFVPVSSADKGHPAVGISIHDRGNAVATRVMVSHQPYGVTDFTLFEVNPETREVVSSDMTMDKLLDMSTEEVAESIHKPVLAAKSTNFSVLDPANQGVMVGAVINQLLRDRFSATLFPPEYASSLRSQIPAYQKFALATSLRYDRLGLEIEFCTSSSSSTSSNICTSTSSSGDIFVMQPQ